MTAILKNNKYARTRVILLIVGLFLLGYCILTILPWQPAPYSYNLDDSWASALHVAFRDRIQFGTDFIYTYGPYGFLRVARYYFPETYSYGLIFCTLIAIAVWVGLFRIVRYCVSRRDWSWIFLVPILWFFPHSRLSIDSFQFLIVILPLVLYFYISKNMTPALVLGTINLALSSLTKHTYFLLAIAVVILITIDEVGKLNRIPRIAPVYIAFIWMFWLVAAQDIGNFPAYLFNSWEVIKGFGASMGIPGHLNEVLLYVLGTGTFLGLISFVEWKNRRLWGILPTLGLAAIFFITFKGAFTRHDAHALQGMSNVIPIMLMFTAILWPSIKNSSWRINPKVRLSLPWLLSFSALFMTIMSVIVLDHYVKFSFSDYVLNTLTFNKERISQVGKMLSGQGNAPGIAEQGKAAIRTDNVLPPVSGTVDLYPNEIATIFAYDLEYRPRPTVQSFSAYTSKLAKLNAEHLTTPDAAENILFDLKPIDGRLASFEDGLSWPEILTRYDITDLENRYLLLKRNSQPRTYKFEPMVQQVDVAMNEWYDIKDGQEPVWGKIDIHPNLIGKLTTAILRLPPLNIEIETADGLVKGYRTIGDIMDDGFLLSPILSSRWDFINFATPNWQDKLSTKQVKRFRIVADGFNAMRYPPKYQVSLSKFKFSRQSFDGVVGWQSWSTQVTIPLPLEGHLQRVNIDNTGETGWLAHAPKKMAIGLSGSETKLSVGFGILEQAVTNGLAQNLGDGVEFKIFALKSDGKKKLLFARSLQPMANQEDRGMQRISVDIDKTDTSQLILETLSREDPSFDWSYWSNLKLE